jgi:hypothetical protein
MTRNGKPKTPEYRLRANRTHNRLKTLCHQWVSKHRPEMLERLRQRAAKDVREEARG